MTKDPHEILGVSSDATPEEIKKAYRNLSKKYHPDLHPDDPDAAAKMAEINAAYDMLMNPEKYAKQQQRDNHDRSDSGGQGYSGGCGQQEHREYHGTGGWYSDFGGFDFEDFFGFGGYTDRPQPPKAEYSDSADVRQSIEYINSGRYKEAVSILNQIVSTGRGARWHYLSSLANHGAGNTILALEQIRKAVQMDPDNSDYRLVLQQYQQAERKYQQGGQGFNMDTASINRVCLGLCAMQLCCRFCGI